MKFLQNIPSEYRHLIENSVNLVWTHNSTALDGNAFSLEESFFFLTEKITIEGKKLAEYNSLFGHMKALDSLLLLLFSPLTFDDMFALHKDIMYTSYSTFPRACWRKENVCITYISSYVPVRDTCLYAHYEDVPLLMTRWMALCNSFSCQKEITSEEAINIYTLLHTFFILIHPFYEGNGRMARLLANFPLLCAGHTPIIFHEDLHEKYLTFLNTASLSMGQLTKNTVFSDLLLFQEFKDICRESLKSISEMIKENEVIFASYNK